MSAPMRNCLRRQFYRVISDNNCILQSSSRYYFKQSGHKTYQSKSGFFSGTLSLKNGIVCTLAVAGAVSLGNLIGKSMKVYAAVKERPMIKPSREIRIPDDTKGLKLTMYQFQTCPFCCKLRSVLDYYGFSYDVIEVNSVTKKQIKWSDYKKVPILVCEDIGEDGFIQLNDSSLIISILESYLVDPAKSIEELKMCYPGMEAEDSRGKKIIEYPSKYFVMYGENLSDSRTPEQRNLERKWRRWADDHMVHMLSPNVYRSPSESLETFRYFDRVGEWEKNFSTFERYMVIYVGAAVMYIMGKIIKRKYQLKDDVRESLYDACNQWTKIIGKNKFLGGEQPNLADVSVYGVLSSIEGCTAFQDALIHTKIGKWYNRMKEACENHLGNTSFHKR